MGGGRPASVSRTRGGSLLYFIFDKKGDKNGGGTKLEPDDGGGIFVPFPEKVSGVMMELCGDEAKHGARK